MPSQKCIQKDLKNICHWNYFSTGSLLEHLCTVFLVPSVLPYYKAHLHIIDKQGVRCTNAYHFMCSQMTLCFKCKKIIFNILISLNDFLSIKVRLLSFFTVFSSNLVYKREVKNWLSSTFLFSWVSFCFISVPHRSKHSELHCIEQKEAYWSPVKSCSLT